MVEVIRAETAGFCMGVDLALNKLDSLIEKDEDRKIYILGPIIHNPQVLEDYEKQGVFTAKTPDEVPDGAYVVIRAHGIPKAVEEDLRKRGVNVIDATCPKVKKAQLLIQRNTEDDRVLLLYGEDSHPEVKGLLSYGPAGPHLFDSLEELQAIDLDPNQKYCLAAQTTQDRAVYDDCINYLENKGIDFVTLKTICDATRQRQDEAISLSEEVDHMIVVGGRISGNTRRLVQVVETAGTKCTHVETADELPLEELKHMKKIGLTAGASTPKRLVDSIQQILEAL
ncbi:4-hydroxy-3-methylbut-2-enyl diphosphate reductase [Maridesulfovibrio salexigens]|uniref:4-hydroxy-3-methylbut-2-enyl diphosphate reductase n=1 Tax=Maridesulfovibrio salexigens (strain ATCC 14822 / DSM 2638 / NCIMB 8403 / VKM B-1763) TaxID=526222 RepID=C6BZI3_MARSD|nr:4-hydroxy-3-methylbut-2-enyl diphosphate reductase [Maridesulfovibrio salexigens]ACS80820.1 hydroxymethylbutenyl pyrophosphate reductase [Maridesulfovibrio salexigens DSM 2638]